MALTYTHDDYTHDSNVSASVSIPAGALILVCCPLFDGSTTSTAPGLPTGSGLTFVEIVHGYSGSTFGVGAWTATAPGGGFSGAITADGTVCFDIAVEHFTGATGSIVQSAFAAAFMDPDNIEFDNNYPSGAITSGNMGYSFVYRHGGAVANSVGRSGWTQAWELALGGNRSMSAWTTTALDTAAGISYADAGVAQIDMLQLEIAAGGGGGGTTSPFIFRSFRTSPRRTWNG
jgi:hypothetical protein